MNGQLEIFEIPSPCIGVCEANNKGFCKGGVRSREERLYWLQFSVDQKREVIRLCQSRRARAMRAWQEALACQRAQARAAAHGALVGNRRGAGAPLLHWRSVGLVVGAE